MALKDFAKDWFPPALIGLMRRARGKGTRFEGDFSSWEEASAQCAGYQAKEILDKVLAATLRVKRGDAAFERDSVVFNEIEYVWPVITGLMWTAARSGGRLNVLDFGGALGSGYFQNRKFLESLQEIRWNVVEQANFVEAGRASIQDERLRFYNSIEECLTENRPNVILLSSVIQYLELPIECLNKFFDIGALSMIIDRTPFSSNEKPKLVVQKVPATIYSASYPMWIFSQSDFMRSIEKDWSLVASNPSPEGRAQTTNGFEFAFQGMLLEARR